MTALGKLFRTTTFKLTLVYLTVFALFAAFLLGYFALNTRRLITEQITDTVNAEITGLSEQYRLGGIRRLVLVVDRARAGRAPAFISSPINRGRIVLDCSMEQLESRYLEVMVHPEQLAAARALKPMHERQGFGRSILLFDAVDRQQLAALGEVRTPSIADLFVAVIGDPAGETQGAAV